MAQDVGVDLTYDGNLFELLDQVPFYIVLRTLLIEMSMGRYAM